MAGNCKVTRSNEQGLSASFFSSVQVLRRTKKRSGMNLLMQDALKEHKGNMVLAVKSVSQASAVDRDDAGKRAEEINEQVIDAKSVLYVELYSKEEK